MATVTSYDMVGIREDLENVIYDVSPTDTPFLTKCAKVKATNTFHEWQTDKLEAATANNAHVEGADTTSDTYTATVAVATTPRF